MEKLEKKNMINSLGMMKVIAKIIYAKGYSPNNPHLPLLIYKQALKIQEITIQAVKNLLRKNNWHSIWVDTVYDYHHYHTNTHEMLVIYAGDGKIQIGGVNGKIYHVKSGDVIFFPAGVAHKKIHASDDFKAIGAYPYAIKYNMRRLKLSTYRNAHDAIPQVDLPKTDPIYGDKGILLQYWKKTKTMVS